MRKLSGVTGHFLIEQFIGDSSDKATTLWTQDEGATWQPIPAPPGTQCAINDTVS